MTQIDPWKNLEQQVLNRFVQHEKNHFKALSSGTITLEFSTQHITLNLLIQLALESQLEFLMEALFLGEGLQLGPFFCIHVINKYAFLSLSYDFISDIDSNAFSQVTSKLNPETTLFIVSSTSFTIMIVLYEHKIYVHSVIWNINPFNQPAIESSKRLMKRGLSYA